MNTVPFLGGSSLTRSPKFDCQRAVNLMPEMGSGQSKDIAMLIGCPGLVLFASLAGGAVRGLLRFNASYSIAVVGGNVYSVTTAGVGTIVGTIVNRTTPVSMASNGLVVMLVTGPEGYVITPTAGAPGHATVTTIIDPSFSGANKVDFIDGYFAFNTPGTQQFRITGQYATTLAPLDFASAEGNPDLLLSLLVNVRELWLFGSGSTEVFFDSGAALFPFERIQGAFIEQGIAAPNSCAKFDGSVAWLSSNDRGQGMVVKAVGYQPTRISTHAQEFAWSSYARIDDAIAFTYQQEGHNFYVLTFPTGNATWVYDANTQLWHERAWRNPQDGSLNRHRANCQMAFAGKIIVGDWENGNLYALDLGTYTDNGAIQPAIRQAPHFANPSNTWSLFDRFWVDMETGVGLSSGQGADIQVVIEWSDDGGYTFPNKQTVSAGKIGNYRGRAVLRRAGKSRDRVWRVTVTDPVRRVFLGAGATVRTCSA